MAGSHGSHDSHAHADHGEVHPHPPIPLVSDEAADTPMWVPAAGLGIFLALVFFALVRASLPSEEPAPQGEPEAAAEAPAEAPQAQ